MPSTNNNASDENEEALLAKLLGTLCIGRGFGGSRTESPRAIYSSDQSLSEKITENQKKKSTATERILIAHWNIGGAGDHCWDISTLFTMIETLNVDVILLSEIKALELKEILFIVKDFDWICLPPLKEYQRKRGLYIIYRKSLDENILRFNGDDSKTHQHQGNVSIEFLSMDFLLSNGTHRVIIAYHEPNGTGECPVDVKDLLADEMATKSDKPNFVHLIGDLNFPTENDRLKLEELLGEHYKPLLHRSWTTHGDNQLDLMYSCGPTEETLKKSVYAHYPVHPYEDLVKQIGTLKSGDTKMTFEKVEEGKEKQKQKQEEAEEQQDENDKKGVLLTINGKKCPSHAKVKEAPEDPHKILLLHAGSDMRHLNVRFYYHCKASCTCFDYSQEKIQWSTKCHTPKDIEKMNSKS